MNNESSDTPIKSRPTLTPREKSLRNKKIAAGCLASIGVLGIAGLAYWARNGEGSMSQPPNSWNEVGQNIAASQPTSQPAQNVSAAPVPPPVLLSDDPADVRTFLGALGYNGVGEFKEAIGPSVGTFTYGLVRDTFDGLQRAEFVFDAKATQRQNKDVYNVTIFPLRYDDALIGPDQAAQIARAADEKISDCLFGARDGALANARGSLGDDVKVDKNQSEVLSNTDDWEVPFSDYLVSTGFTTPVSLDNIAGSSMDQKLTLRHIAALAEDVWFGDRDITAGDTLAAHRRNLSGDDYVATGEINVSVPGGTKRVFGGVYQVGKNLDMRLGEGQ